MILSPSGVFGHRPHSACATNSMLAHHPGRRVRCAARPTRAGAAAAGRGEPRRGARRVTPAPSHAPTLPTWWT
eukprot:239663-Prymnesium_polylepis.2